MVPAQGFVLRFNVQVICTFMRKYVTNKLFMLESGMDELIPSGGAMKSGCRQRDGRRRGVNGGVFGGTWTRLATRLHHACMDKCTYLLSASFLYLFRYTAFLN
jgi:hypothetical protein